MRRLLKSIFIMLVGFNLLSSIFVFQCFGDMLSDVYSRAGDNYVQMEGAEVVDGGAESMIVRASKMLLNITTGLGVTMIVYGGTSFILTMGEEGKMKKAKSNVSFVVAGIVMAMSSVAIIKLIQSITLNTLPK